MKHRPTGWPRRPQREASSERGATVVELVMWAPVVFIVLAFLVFAFRSTTTNSEVAAAARSAARAAAGERTPAQAIVAGTDAASFLLTTDICESPTITVDTDQWSAGTVTATVTCTPDTSGLMWNRSVTSSWTEAVNQVRQQR